MRHSFTVSILVLLTASSSHAQEWTTLQALAPNTPVRLQDRRGRQAEGLLASVEDAQLTLVAAKQPFIIPKQVIKRVQVRKSESLAEGILGGLLYAVLTQSAYGDSSWTPWQITGHFVGSIGFGAFMDWRIKNHRTVYRAP